MFPKSSVFHISVLLLHLTSIISTAVVQYTLEVAYITGSPDGVLKENGILGINGQFPGPTLEANVGDTLEVTVINSIQDGQDTSMHWHGIHQKNSLFEDGASMVTSCPIPPGESKLYRFNVTQTGTYWYHSHFKSQYTEGMFGLLIVHGIPEVYPADGGEFTVILSDWFHYKAHDNEKWHLSPDSNGVPPYPDSGLINGMGRYPCQYAVRQNRSCQTTEQFRPVFRVQKDKKYRLRLISASAYAAFNFSIDQHALHTIEVDGVDVATPVKADAVQIAAGMRYSFYIQCPSDAPSGKRYLMRANLRDEILLRSSEVDNINSYPDALISHGSAVLECHDGDFSRFRNHVEITKEQFTANDILPSSHRTDLEYLDEMELLPYGNETSPEHIDQRFGMSATFLEDLEDIRRGSFNYRPFALPNDKPVLMQLIDGDRIDESVFPLYIKHGSVVEVVINNPYFGPHPFHLHGHHFWVMGSGPSYDGNFDRKKHHLARHGVRRDTVLVQEHSWAVIRFVADNPGVWLFHCHIDWHNLSGMALTFIEGAEIVRNTTRIPDEARKLCQTYRDRRISISHNI